MKNSRKEARLSRVIIQLKVALHSLGCTGWGVSLSGNRPRCVDEASQFDLFFQLRSTALLFSIQPTLRRTNVACPVLL
jgi:hypothetical protein